MTVAVYIRVSSQSQKSDSVRTGKECPPGCIRARIIRAFRELQGPVS
jgi:hypothetical protein